MIRDITLREYIAYYRDNADTRLSDGYVEQLHVAVRLLERASGRTLRVRDLCDELVNDFLDWLAQEGRSPETIRGRRNSILALWRHAIYQGVLDRAPLRVRRLRCRRRLPVAWTAEEVRQLIQTARQRKRTLPIGICKGIYYASLFAAGWDSALRLGDLLALRCGQVIPEVPLIVTQHKTHDDVLVTFTAETAALIKECEDAGPPRAEIWPLWMGRRQLYRHVNKIVKLAGIRPGTFKFIRRGAITSVESLGGNGALIAGHRGRAVTERHYIDRAHLMGLQPRPASLWE